jgi:hypothetical protein
VDQGILLFYLMELTLTVCTKKLEIWFTFMDYFLDLEFQIQYETMPSCEECDCISEIIKTYPYNSKFEMNAFGK